MIEFSYTHHGDQVVEYFYNQARKKEALLKRDAFRLRGMRPKTRETAVVMLIDSVKAASRTVSLPSPLGFEEMVSRIVQPKLLARQLDESSLTSSELRIISEQVVDILMHMHQSRAKYPWQNKGTALLSQLKMSSLWIVSKP